MSAVVGFRILTGTYLGQDWELFGSTPEMAIATFVREQSSETVAASITGFEELLATSMTDDELDDRWVMGLDSAYDPRDDGWTYRDWFAHALALLKEHAVAREQT